MLRIGSGFDIHRLVAGRPLVIGGVTIEHDKGLAGHSDADVLAHAVCDALLGAAALGDIGEHFPDTDPIWQGADSMELLSKVAGMLQENNWSIVNVDCTVIAQEPRLAPHRDAMRTNLAKSCGMDKSRVSVKATTAEGAGSVGRKESMAAQAVVMIQDDVNG